MFSGITALLPKQFVFGFTKQLRYNNMPINERELLGFLTILSLAIGFGFAINLSGYFGIHPKYFLAGWFSLLSLVSNVLDNCQGGTEI